MSDQAASGAAAGKPEGIEAKPRHERSGLALCLSGGGFRATLFHCGAMQRLNELGILSRIDTITSVSGGSISSGMLAQAWPALKKSEAGGVFTAFDQAYRRPLHEFCRKDLRTNILVWDRANPKNWFKLASSDYSVTDKLCEAYAKHLGMSVPLSSLPSHPKFIFCASNLETGACWRFEAGPQGRMGDTYTGWAAPGTTPLAAAVTASSAFPVTFPPLILKFDDPAIFKGGRPRDGQTPDASRKIALTDGGVYDNLGLEPVWKSHKTLLVSDAGKPFSFDGDPGVSPLARLMRVFDVSANQIGALRTRWLVERLKSQNPERKLEGTYWGISTEVDEYEPPAIAGETGSTSPDAVATASPAPARPLPGFSGQSLKLLKAIRTDLNAFSEAEIACLENHGYALADAAIHRYQKDLIKVDEPFEWPNEAFVSDAALLKALENAANRDVLHDLWDSVRGK